MTKQTILVIGLGLIGGSLAKAIGQKKDRYIIGSDTDPQTVEFALMSGVIDESATSIRDAVRKADVVILGTPVSETITFIQEIDAIPLEHHLVMTDVCSVKSSIMLAADQMTNPNISFIGGHPMAGSHKKGIMAAKSHLFENAIYVLSPFTEHPETDLDQLQELLSETKSNFIILKPDEHDEMTGVVSHFPHLIASSLVHQAKEWEHTHTFIPKLAAGGFRDITRIASSDPTMWQDIFYHNREKMSQLLEDWIKEMTKLKQLIDHNRNGEITAYLNLAKEYRDGLEKDDKGAIPAFHDMYVDIPDQTGAIASVMQSLAAKEISIKNIEILEIRDNITGVLRLSFPTEAFRQEANRILAKKGYEIIMDV